MKEKYMEMDEGSPSPRDILTLVADQFNLKIEDLAGMSDAKTVTYARNLANLLVKNHTAADEADIGIYLGGRHTKQIIAGRKAAEALIQYHPLYLAMFNELDRTIARRRRGNTVPGQPQREWVH